MNTQIGSATEGKLGSNVLREPEINKSTETIKPSKGFLSRRSFLFVKRLVFVFLLLAALSSFAGTAMAQSEPQQFVVVYVEFKPANARAGGDVLQQLEARAEDSAGVIRFDVLQQIDRPNFFSLCSRSGATRRPSRTSRTRPRPRPS